MVLEHPEGRVDPQVDARGLDETGLERVDLDSSGGDRLFDAVVREDHWGSIRAEILTSGSVGMGAAVPDEGRLAAFDGGPVLW
jgi:hypothetical protein